MKETKEKSAAFTGHRYVPFAQRAILKERIKGAVIDAYKLGFRRFHCGMAVGFDMLAAEVVLSLKTELKSLVLVAVVPFRGQDFRFNDSDKRRYKMILSKVDEVVVLSDKYYKGCLLRRNDYMIEKSRRLIAFYNGEPKGGTFYTCRHAENRQIPVVNLY